MLKLGNIFRKFFRVNILITGIGMGKILSVSVFLGILTSIWFSMAIADSGAVLCIGKDVRTKRTIVVNVQENPSASGAALLDALSDITDATKSNPYLIKIEPGIYDIGTKSLVMKQYVTIEGSGGGCTKILGSTTTTGVVCGADNSDITNLTVVSKTSGGEVARAIFNGNASPTIHNVTVFASGAGENIGIHNYNGSAPLIIGVEAYASGGNGSIGISNNPSSSPIIRDSVCKATDAAVYNWGIYNGQSSSPRLLNLVIEASGGDWAIGINNYDSSAPTLVRVEIWARNGTDCNVGMLMNESAAPCTAKVDMSIFRAYGYNNKSIFNGAGSTLYIGASRLDGPRQGSGSWKCSACYDGSYNTLNSVCQ
jgi:hypothetical protein